MKKISLATQKFLLYVEEGLADMHLLNQTLFWNTFKTYVKECIYHGGKLLNLSLSNYFLHYKSKNTHTSKKDETRYK